MKLYIDTRDNSKTIIGLGKDRLEEPVGANRSQQVLFLINQLLAQETKSLKDITEIKVETGPGSFTGLRVGIAVANTLGWVLQVPVNDKNKSAEPVYA